MRGVIVLLIILVLPQFVFADIDEEIYGINYVRLWQEAEVHWIRETQTIIYDFKGNRNRYVSQLQDNEITHILKNHKSREFTGINEVNLTPAFEALLEAELRGDVEEIAEAPVKPVEKPKEVPEEVIIIKSFEFRHNEKAKCFNSIPRIPRDPFYRFDIALGNLGDDNLDRILDRIRTSCSR